MDNPPELSTLGLWPSKLPKPLKNAKFGKIFPYYPCHLSFFVLIYFPMTLLKKAQFGEINDFFFFGFTDGCDFG
jgi:hypothetical protein